AILAEQAPRASSSHSLLEPSIGGADLLGHFEPGSSTCSNDSFIAFACTSMPVGFLVSDELGVWNFAGRRSSARPRHPTASARRFRGRKLSRLSACKAPPPAIAARLRARS